MSAQEEGRPLPKFGEWDVNDPASAEGFTVIFNKAREEKKGGGSAESVTSQSKYGGSCKENDKRKYSIKKKWFCCG
ncbi:protein NOI4-like [Eucalyptus grandis]|uniref:protein NOI4-like n=1 Tax=Eucalyptus grandis TaxID=71139 RepID=UPI000525DD39|nr:protein NOI4-like [Eucalyptus grandis]XP_039162249.1 protein NOI4-like [Eucalyptus grandis]